MPMEYGSGCGSAPGSCANPVTTSGTPVMAETQVDVGCKPSSGFGVVGCLEYVRYEVTIAATTVIARTIFPTVGKVQPIGILDSRSGADVYFQDPKVGDSDVLPSYSSDTIADVNPRSVRIADQDATAYRAGIQLVGTIPVVIDPNTRMQFDLENTGVGSELAEFYFLFLRAQG